MFPFTYLRTPMEWRTSWGSSVYLVRWAM